MEVYGGSQRRVKVTTSDINRLKKGGQRADELYKMQQSHHENVELPLAEKFLIENLEKTSDESDRNKEKKIPKKKQSFFSKCIIWLKSLFQSS